MNVHGRREVPEEWVGHEAGAWWVGREVEGGEPWTPCVVAGGGVDGGVSVGEGV